MAHDERLKERIEAAQHWLHETRERYWEAAHDVKELERFRHGDGSLEDLEHFQKRRAREKARRDNREDLKDHLTKKVTALEATLKNRKEARAERRGSIYDKDGTAIVIFDGVPVVESAAYWLKLSREAGWPGRLVSGYRDPEYSESLCQNMCGAPSCPGRCAGRASGHSQRTYPGPCVDVSEYGQFEQIQWQIGSPLKNDLPIDPVHFSPTGH